MSIPTRTLYAGLLTAGVALAAAAQPPTGPGAGMAREESQRFDRTAPKVGRVMPNLQIYDADGKQVWLHDELRGHPSVLILGCLT